MTHGRLKTINLLQLLGFLYTSSTDSILFVFRGARHGLRALGKLARIAEQEQMLLTQPQYEGYSHAKKLKQKAEERIDQMTLEEDVLEVHKKKKKRKRCSNEVDIQLVELESSLPEELLKSKNRDTGENKIDTNSELMIVDCEIVKKTKKKKRMSEDEQTQSLEIMDKKEVSEKKIKKKKKKKVKDDQMDC